MLFAYAVNFCVQNYRKFTIHVLGQTSVNSVDPDQVLQKLASNQDGSVKSNPLETKKTVKKD